VTRRLFVRLEIVTPYNYHVISPGCGGSRDSTIRCISKENTMPEFSAAAFQMTHVIQVLAKVGPTKNGKGNQRFPHLFRNGEGCQCLARGSCWFQHGQLRKDINMLRKTENSTPKDGKAFEPQTVMSKLPSTRDLTTCIAMWTVALHAWRQFRTKDLA